MALLAKVLISPRMASPAPRTMPRVFLRALPAAAPLLEEAPVLVWGCPRVGGGVVGVMHGGWRRSSCCCLIEG